MNKTDLEIQAEWKALKVIRPTLVHFTRRYRINQWAQVDAQIATLYHRLTMPEIKQRWPDGDIQGAAEDARYWMDGGEILSPVEAWKSTPANFEKPAENQGVTVGNPSVGRF